MRKILRIICTRSMPWSPARGRITPCGLAMLALAWGSPALAVPPAWTGAGSHRLLVRVEPVNIGGRPADELVAALPVNFEALIGSTIGADLATLQVHKYDPATGAAEAFATFDNAISPHDRPCRFDDNAVPIAYPDRAGYASDFANGRAPITLRQRGGRLFNREMDNTSGQVIWTHTQVGNQPSYYAIYFDVRGPGVATGMSPSPWIGDVDLYRRETGQSLGGLAHFTAAVGDLNGDGLFDLVAGAEKGDLMWFANRGTPGDPVFPGCKMVTDEVGPIDLGWYAAPYLFDWDADGKLDLLVGTSHNVILWWKNTGTTTSPSFVYQGFIQSDGVRLQVPQSPVPEDTSGSFSVDYYNQPWIGDFNADGLPDILTGGYTTGRVFYWRCTGRGAGNVPLLTFAGTVNADGQPIDTGWAASPTAYDVDNDGRLELFTGSWGYPSAVDPTKFLLYYRNAGTQAAPSYTLNAFPRTGSFPGESIARASVTHWNGDALPDLLVSAASGNVRVFLHDGTLGFPHWRVDSPPLTGSWGFVPVPSFMSVADLDQNGEQALLSGTAVYKMQGSLHSPTLAIKGSATVNGAPIWHPGPGYGDGYNWNIFTDWDKDGLIDILSGTQQGNCYFHRNLGAPSNLVFAAGIKLTLTNGQDLKVGPPIYEDPEDVPDFTALQGSRMIMAAADFDADGIDDLAVTETYGNIWIFRNSAIGGTSTLQPGVIVLSGPRLDGLDIIDWNLDNKPDLITTLSIADPGSIFINQSSGSGSFSFAAAIQPLGLPFCFWGPIFHSTDYNADGDRDFLIRSEFFYFWAERSFIDHGYVPAITGVPDHWTSTFDSGPDGVEYIYHSTARDMIGTASDGKLPITVYNAATGTDFNRAGRPMLEPVSYEDSFGALYKFAWSQLYQGDEQSGWGAVDFAGFVGDSGGQMFRQMLGALIQHKKSGSFYYIKLGVMLGAGTQDGFQGDASWLNLGTAAPGTNYQLSQEYNGATHVLTVAFKNAAGATLRSLAVDVDNLLTPANLAQLNLTHVGWSDYSGAIGAWTATNIPFPWLVDELSFHQTIAAQVEVQTGSCCLVSSGTCLADVTATTCAEQSGRFDGVGSTCGQVLCQSLCPVPFADSDRDGDVDVSDFAAFQLCMTGENDPQGIFDEERCGCFDRGTDLPGDEDIDASDFAKFLGCMNGPDQPPVPGCDS